MKLIKLAILATFAGLATSAMANTVILKNTSRYTIPVQYRLAYHTPGQPVVHGPLQETTLPGNSIIPVTVEQAHNKHVGLILEAVENDGQWINLPPQEKVFDGQQGCWVSTNHHKTSGTMELAMRKTKGKHGSITCRVSSNIAG